MGRKNKSKKYIRISLWYANNERRRKRAKKKAKILNIKRSKRKKDKYRRDRNKPKYNSGNKIVLSAPKYFSLLDSPNEVIGFINKIDSLLSNIKKISSVEFDLKDVTKIDIGAICLFLSKLNDLSRNKIRYWGTFPEDKQCCEFINNSGFLDRMKDSNTGQKYSRKNKNLILNSGLDKTDNAATSKEIRKAVEYLTGKEGNYKPIYSIALEICANSVEHANDKRYKKNWLLSTSYMDKQVVFTMTDVGDGILKTIKRKVSKKVKELFFKDAISILTNVFDKKYESRTGDSNRNKGLPKIYKTSLEKYISNLIVVTNNVLLDFDNPNKSKILNKNFKGTFYYWILNEECIEKWEKR